MNDRIFGVLFEFLNGFLKKVDCVANEAVKKGGAWLRLLMMQPFLHNAKIVFSRVKSSGIWANYKTGNV